MCDKNPYVKVDIIALTILRIIELKWALNLEQNELAISPRAAEDIIATLLPHYMYYVARPVAGQ